MNAEGNALPDRPLGFWVRRFKRLSAYGRTAFDPFFGILLPLLCVAIASIWGTNRGGAEYSIFGFSEFTIGIVALGYYLIIRRATALLGDVLLAGGFFLPFGPGPSPVINHGTRLWFHHQYFGIHPIDHQSGLLSERPPLLAAIVSSFISKTFNQHDDFRDGGRFDCPGNS